MMTKSILPRYNFDWCYILLLSLLVIRWQYGEKSLIEASHDVDDVQGDDVTFSRGQELASYWCDEDQTDYVHSLPGYVPVEPPSCWYSGYLTYDFLGRTINTHYTLQIAEFLDSQDEKDIDNYSPLQKPLIYWSS